MMRAMGLVSTSKSALRGMAKAVIFPVLGSAQLLRRRLDRVRAAGVTTVLNLHRVAPVDGSSYAPLAPALFEELLAFVTREFSVVTFGELGETSSKPKLVLSFDDGYRDFVTHAVPAMKRHGAGPIRTSYRSALKRAFLRSTCLRRTSSGRLPASWSQI